MLLHLVIVCLYSPSWNSPLPFVFPLPVWKGPGYLTEGGSHNWFAWLFSCGISCKSCQLEVRSKGTDSDQMFLTSHVGFLLYATSHQEITSAVSLVVKWSLVKAVTAGSLHCKDPLSPLQGPWMSGTVCISCDCPNVHYSNVNRQ